MECRPPREGGRDNGNRMGHGDMLHLPHVVVGMTDDMFDKIHLPQDRAA